jgi:hypothetical protein
MVPSVLATDFHTIQGILYIDDVVADPGVQIKLDVPEKSFTTIIETNEPNPYNFYAGFEDHLFGGTTVYFTVLYKGYELIPVDNESIILNKNVNPIEEYIIDLHVYLPANKPPNKPSLISPANGSTLESSNSATLKVEVTDPDDDPMDVYFYDDSDDSLIGSVTDVASGDSAQVSWLGLSANTTYHWYAVANDSQLETKSDTWSFNTSGAENKDPKVCIVKPQRGLYIFNSMIRRYLFRFRIPLIIGKITIIANATDEDSGIERVEFYINGELKETDTTEPYSYLWRWNRPRLIHIFCITVVAYDNEGVTAEDCMIVRKFL